MPIPKADTWAEVSPYLDEALAIPGHERAAWLAALRERNPAAAAHVEALLDEHRALIDQHFLEDGVTDAPHHFDDGAGLRCGPYRLVTLIGRGGMGSVYLGERADGEVTQRVAVKLLPSSAGEIHRERFLQERQILATLAHSNIARMLDAGHTEHGQPFLAMEYIEGKPIDAFASELGRRQKIELFLKVCSAVSYLHQNLVVHRDLKPGNIFVTPQGEPKLLDFGIAKILDLAAESTQTAVRMLTPAYASPEQIAGARVSTASDIYSLGAVLYELLTGKHAHQFDAVAPGAIAAEVASREVTRPRKWVPDLSPDLESILLHALRQDPRDRYGTVEQFAGDLEAYLESRPVRARGGNAWYRTRKFLRRSWVPITAVSIAIAGLTAGVFVANQQRRIAQKRFQDVRQLAGRFLSLDGTLATLPGALKARREVIGMSKDYLQALSLEAKGDQDLAVELAGVYLKLAQAQGIPTGPSLGETEGAQESLDRGAALLDSVLAKSPQMPEAHFTYGKIDESRMILADTAAQRQKSLRWGQECAEHLETFLRTRPEEVGKAGKILSNVALAYKNAHRYADSIRYARRAAELARSSNEGKLLSNSLSVEADARRLSGDLDGALEAIRQARKTTDNTDSSWHFNVAWREGGILRDSGQTDAARATYQEAFDVVEERAQKFPDDVTGLSLFASAGRELGALLAELDPRRALEVYDHAVSRLREIKLGNKARRGEAELLAASSYPLRKLNREPEGKQRIEAALAMLEATRDYPVATITPNSEVDHVLRALADHHTAMNQPRKAAGLYEELLAKVQASSPDPENDIGHSEAVSKIYQNLARLYLRTGQIDRAQAMTERRRAIWESWSKKRPGNLFVKRQLEDALR
ncbi:MAG: protein kinase [Bryobacteraceae bacterium]